MDGHSSALHPISAAQSVLEDSDEDLRIFTDHDMELLDMIMPADMEGIDQIPADMDIMSNASYTDSCDDCAWDTTPAELTNYNWSVCAPLAAHERRWSTGSSTHSWGSDDVSHTPHNPPQPSTPIKNQSRRRRDALRNPPKTKVTLPSFMAEKLKDPQFNPDIIKYLDEKKGVFLIVKPKKMAELWGLCKGNPRMNYPSMSRGIRERRKYGWFEPVPTDSKYPKKLTYKWGPMAMDLLRK